MKTLTHLEQAVLDKLLAGEHSVLNRLRRQLPDAEVVERKYTGVGFFCLFRVLEKSHRVVEKGDFEIGDVLAEIPGLRNGAGFVLFVRNGYLHMLEGYTYDEPWPESIDSFKLEYTTRGERSLNLA